MAHNFFEIVILRITRWTTDGRRVLMVRDDEGGKIVDSWLVDGEEWRAYRLGPR